MLTVNYSNADHLAIIGNFAGLFITFFSKHASECIEPEESNEESLIENIAKPAMRESARVQVTRHTNGGHKCLQSRFAWL